MMVAAKKTSDFDEVRGVNTVAQLEEANEILRKRRNLVQSPLLFK